MRNNLLYLLKVQYLNQSPINVIHYEKDAKKRRRSLAMLLIYAFIAVVLVGYCYGMGYGYGLIGCADMIPSIALLIASVLVLFFTFFKANGFLFAYKDYDLVMALPFSTSEVITSRFLYMYISNLVVTTIVMIPMGVAYAMWNPMSAGRCIMWLILTCFVPLLPMTIAVAAGALIAAIGSKFRCKVLVQTVLSIGLLILAFCVSFFMQGIEEDAVFLAQIEQLIEQMQQQIHRWYPMSILFEQAVCEGRILLALSFICLSLGIYLIFIQVISKKYKAINTALMTSHSSSNYKLTGLRASSVLRVLVWKEAKRFTSSTLYLTNIGVGVILALAASVGAAVFGMDRMLELLQIQELLQNIIYLAPFIMAVPLTMTCTTSVSLSLEGKHYWILQSLPIEQGMIYKGKMVFNMLLLLPVAFISDVCIALVLKIDILTFVLYLAVSAVLVLFSTVVGMIIGIRFANFGWENEVEVIKQGMASMLGIFGNIILMLLFCVVAFFLSSLIDGRLALIAITVVVGVIAIVLWSRLTGTDK